MKYENTTAGRASAALEAASMLVDAKAALETEPSKALKILNDILEDHPNALEAVIAERIIKSTGNEPVQVQGSSSGGKSKPSKLGQALFALPFLGMLFVFLIQMSVLVVMAFDAGFSWSGAIVAAAVWGTTAAVGIFMVYLVVRLFL